MGGEKKQSSAAQKKKTTTETPPQDFLKKKMSDRQSLLAGSKQDQEGGGGGGGFGKALLIFVVVLLLAAAIGLPLYFLVFKKKVPSSIPPGGCPVGRACFALTALGGDCTIPCASPTLQTCLPGASVNTSVYLNSTAQLELVDGVNAVISPFLQTAGPYVFPTAQTTAAFLSAVLVSKNAQGTYSAAAPAMFNASNPGGPTTYPAGFQQFPSGSNDGTNFATWVAAALAPRTDGMTNVGILMVLNGGPALFAAQPTPGTTPAAGTAAWSVLQAMKSLGACPVWQSLVGATGPSPTPQSYCAAYDFGANHLSESTATPNCVALLQGMFAL